MTWNGCQMSRHAIECILVILQYGTGIILHCNGIPRNIALLWSIHIQTHHILFCTIIRWWPNLVLWSKLWWSMGIYYGHFISHFLWCCESIYQRSDIPRLERKYTTANGFPYSNPLAFCKNACLLYVDPLFWKLVLNDSCFLGLT